MARAHRNRKRRRFSEKRNDPVLQEVDLDILAYLDHTIGLISKGLPDKELFIRTVVPHLQKRCGHQLTLQQVRKKLKFCSKTWSVIGYDIYRQGSECLINLDPSVKQQIHDRRLALEFQKLQESVQTPVRFTRSKSLASELVAGSHVSLETETGVGASSRKRKLEDTRFRQTVSPLQKHSSPALPEDITNISRSPATSASGNSNYLDTVTVPFVLFPNNESSNTISVPQIKLANQSDASSPLSSLSSSHQNKACVSVVQEDTINGLRHEARNHSVPQLGLLDSFEDIIFDSAGSFLTDRLEMLRSMIHAHLNACEERAREAEAARENMQEQLTTLQDTLLSLNNTTSAKEKLQELMNRLQAKEMEVYKLETTLDKNREIERILRNKRPWASTSNGHYELSDLCGLADNLREKTRTLFCECEIIPQCQTADWQHDKYLLTLLSQTFGTHCHSELQVQLHALLNLEASARLLLRSLLSSAICFWVLKTEITELAAEETQLVGRYRQLLKQLTSAEIAESLDFTVHNDLAQDPAFQDIAIHQRAKMLAESFLEALLKICTPLLEQGTENDAKSLDWSHEYHYVKGVFECALRLRLAVALSHYELEAEMFYPGTKVQPCSMERELSSFGAGDIRTGDSEIVKLCLHPVLAVHKKRQGWIRPRHFTSDTEILDKAAGKIVAKALVVYGEELIRGSFVADSEDDTLRI